MKAPQRELILPLMLFQHRKLLCFNTHNSSNEPAIVTRDRSMSMYDLQAEIKGYTMLIDSLQKEVHQNFHFINICRKWTTKESSKIKNPRIDYLICNSNQLENC
jgi:hypothetical protein